MSTSPKDGLYTIQAVGTNKFLTLNKKFAALSFERQASDVDKQTWKVFNADNGVITLQNKKFQTYALSYGNSDTFVIGDTSGAFWQVQNVAQFQYQLFLGVATQPTFLTGSLDSIKVAYKADDHQIWQFASAD